ncbi:alpha/beta hydrolase [Rhodocaloribacter litoris]|uniref:alpha/beta hydrolase n=1 Tax=Rhodocaloribacter litoris TaxID=2558931 RepID=UPI001423324A|nr:alpha/beta hydrolase [Rhodocaloribacter litoris]QXD14613.1 alpha/beta hydrolase [Rhodocaloribacter litoris]GIV59615.1 MAG: alpha/beta hydrolase [Rhodothermaceae bacterium]
MLLTLLGGYALLVLVVFTFQHRLLFLPSPDLGPTPAAHGLAYEDVTLETEDGERLHGWWIPAEHPRATLLLFHGNAGNISGRLPLISVWHGLGLNVFVFDYRGYGRSTGTPSEEGLYRDAAAAWHYLTATRGLAPEEVLLLGRSLGGGPATWLAERAGPGALILESTFTSVPDVAARHYPFLPVRWLARHRFDNLDRIRRIRVPVLVIHSPEDEIVPYAHGRALFDAAAGPKTFLEIAGRHNDGFAVSAPRYTEGVRAFLASLDR